MARLIWSKQSIDDLNHIAEYISKDSVFYAKRTVKKIRRKSKEIIQNPLSGQIVPELGNPQVREKIEGNFRIIYRISESGVIEILTVFHTSRNLRQQ